MEFSPRDAKYLTEILRLPIDLKQRLERFASRSGELRNDDIDRLLSLCGQRLPEILFDQNGKRTERGTHLEQLIDKLKYS